MCETKSVTSAIYIDRSPDEAAAYINNPDMAIQSEDNLVLDNGHTLQFIGKVGLFSPIKSGCGGGSLVRQNTDKNGNVKYDSVVGTKDYRTVDRTALAEEKPTGHSLVHFGPGLALEHPAALERL